MLIMDTPKQSLTNRPESPISITEIYQEKTPPNLPLPVCTPDDDPPQRLWQSNRIWQRPGYIAVSQAANHEANQVTFMTADENLNFHINLLQANQAIAKATDDNREIHSALHHICNGIVHPISEGNHHPICQTRCKSSYEKKMVRGNV